MVLGAYSISFVLTTGVHPQSTALLRGTVTCSPCSLITFWSLLSFMNYLGGLILMPLGNSVPKIASEKECLKLDGWRKFTGFKNNLFSQAWWWTSGTLAIPAFESLPQEDLKSKARLGSVVKSDWRMQGPGCSLVVDLLPSVSETLGSSQPLKQWRLGLWPCHLTRNLF